MLCIFQLVSAEHGFRSEPFTCERGELANMLREKFDLEERADDMVLTLAEIPENGEIVVSRAPLMRISTWRNYFPELELEVAEHG